MSSFDPLDIRGQELSREKAQERAAAAAKTEEEDIKWLMANKRGRRIVYRLLERAGVWRLSFNTNALQMAFNEGNRNEGLALTAKLMAYCPDAYATMTKEQQGNG
jgi:hypothetical protein